MKEGLPGSQDESILHLLMNKYHVDPRGFESYLPEVAHELRGLLPSRSLTTHRSAVTEQERDRLQKTLAQLLSAKEVSKEGAIQALECCVTLIQDGCLPTEVDRRTLLGLLHRIIGGPITKMTKATEIAVWGGEAVKEMSLLRGVRLRLAWNDRLVAISVSPTKLKERSGALRFVGIAKDTVCDVAEHLDSYLAKEISSGGT